jgi:hypothetical protein
MATGILKGNHPAEHGVPPSKVDTTQRDETVRYECDTSIHWAHGTVQVEECYPGIHRADTAYCIAKYANMGHHI